MATLNRMLSKCLLLVIRGYQYFLSPYIGNACRFHPTCSKYAIAAFKTKGFWQGIYFTFRRLLRCHPWHPGGVDPVP